MLSSGRFWLIVGCFVVLTGSSLAVGWVLIGHLSRPAQRLIGSPPPDLPASAISFSNALGIELSGWAIDIEPRCGSVVLLHGIRADRRAMLDRARMFASWGYASLLFDLQAHGESGGTNITFGQRERLDAEAALALARQRWPGGPVVLVGLSLGGAAALLGNAAQDSDAVVLEGVFASLDNALGNRLAVKLGWLGRSLTPVVRRLGQWRLGIDPIELGPVEAIQRVSVPVLVANGALDRRTTPDEAVALKSAAAGHSVLWIVEGAGHVDLHRFAPQAYEARLKAFLARYVPCGVPGPSPRPPT